MISFIIDHPAFVSAFAALVSLLFSIFVYFNARRLLKRKERPMLLIDGIVYEPTSINLRIKNSGENPASDLNITLALAPSTMPDKYKISRSSEFSNVIGPGHTVTIILGRNEKENKIICFYFKYKDAFTNKAFEEKFWLRFDKESRQIFEARVDEIKEFMPHAQARIKEFRDIKAKNMPS